MLEQNHRTKKYPEVSLVASKTVAEAGYAPPLNLGFHFKQQDQDMLDQDMYTGGVSGHTQATCPSKRTNTPWPAPKLG